MSDYFDQIESYFADEMSPSQRLEFEQELATNSELSESLENYKIINNALEINVENNLRDQLNQLAQTETKLPEAKQFRIGIRHLAIAASVALLVAAGYWIMRPIESSIQPVALVEYYHFEEDLSRGQGDYSGPLSEGLDLMAAGKVNEASTFFDNFIRSNPDQYSARFILGDLLYENGKLDEARLQMDTILMGQSLLWKEKAQLNYLLLSQKTSWTPRSEQILEEVLQDLDHPYRQQALQIQKTSKH